MRQQLTLFILITLLVLVLVSSINIEKRGSRKRPRHSFRETVELAKASKLHSLPLTELLETETCLSAPNIVGLDNDHPDYPSPPQDPPGTVSSILPIPYRPPVKPVPGTTCCNQMSCPYADGICCPYSTHCCPAHTMCVHDSDPPMCDDGITVQHKKVVRIVQVDVDAEPIVAATMSPLPSNDSVPAPPPPTDVVPSNRSGSNYDDELTQLISYLQNRQPLPPPTVQTNNYLVGKSWPPMAAFAPDGSGNNSFIFYNQRDWTGSGMIRNGTYNFVNSQQECEQQCDALLECRVYKYERTAGQCWLDTELSNTASECPVVNNKSDCMSAIKRATKQDVYNPYGATTTNPADWIYKNMSNFDLGFNRLVRNGRFNLLSQPSLCLEQCSKLAYCRVAVYLRSTQECWLSSKVRDQGQPCASRNGIRDCVSFIKMEIVPDGVRPTLTPISTQQAQADYTQVVSHNGEGDKAFDIAVQVGNN